VTLSALTAETIAESFGSRHWQELMSDGLPYASGEGALAAAQAAFGELTREDWLESFATHSPIGAVRPGQWTDAREQSGMITADDELRMTMAAANLEYQSRFGFVFLIRAQGRSGPEMLEHLRERLTNPPEIEFQVACDQAREIALRRLQALIDAEAA
jgi:OHCU decarboxylase